MAVLRVRDPFSCDVGGVFRVYRVGDLVDSSDPVVTPKRLELFFEPAEVAANRSLSTVEQTTAAPNERRTLTTRKRAESSGA